jgi:hypothetical protein
MGVGRYVDSQDGYREALVKNMPSETVGGYLAILGLTSGVDQPPAWLLWLIWAVFLVATPLYLWLLKPKNVATERPWWQIWIFGPIAFFVWSLTIGGPWAGIDKIEFIGGVLVILFSVVVFPLVSMLIAKAAR